MIPAAQQRCQGCGAAPSHPHRPTCPSEFEHFVHTQGKWLWLAQRTTYERALREIKLGKKGTCWMWWIFPQIAGLGTSPTSIKYALANVGAARRYLEHPLLGSRLIECSKALLTHTAGNKTAVQILGELDAMKLHASMTLFNAAAPDYENVFRAVLLRYFDGDLHDKTFDILNEQEKGWGEPTTLTFTVEIQHEPGDGEPSPTAEDVRSAVEIGLKADRIVKGRPYDLTNLSIYVNQEG